MFWKALVNAVGHGAIILALTFVISFILLNAIVECETWEDSACITPIEFFPVLFGDSER